MKTSFDQNLCTKVANKSCEQKFWTGVWTWVENKKLFARALQNIYEQE